MELQEYFQSYEGYFWEWENEVLTANSVYETVSIPGGNTIAYEHFVMETLELLGADSLPPFGSFLLVLTATNPNSKESLERIFKIVKHIGDVRQLEYANEDVIAPARKFLDMLATLPDSFKQGEKRKQLLWAVFHNCHNRLGSDKAAKIFTNYKNHKHQLLRCGEKAPFSDANFRKDFGVIFRIAQKFPTRISLLNAMSGLPEMPQVEEELAEQQPAPSQKTFVQQLIDEPKTFPVGSLIQRIWGGLNIPLHHAAPSTQPLGGVSDLANKGDFDKLLISEFANEDEVFMSRIANNEALYIKREAPPEADKFLRLLLLDNSLKNWGTPKILGFAAALAIAKHPKTDIECRAFVLGNGYREVQFNTVEEVIDGLGHLGSGLDAAHDLEQLLLDNAALKNAELFLVTSEDALKEDALQRAISEHYEKIKYIITTDAIGNLDFYKVQNKGRKAVQHIALPLDELWAGKPKERITKTSKNKRETDFPDNYPILFPLPQKLLAGFKLDGDYYLLSNSRSLFKTGIKVNLHNSYSNERLGAKLLLGGLSVSANGSYCLGRDEALNYILVSFFPKDHLLSWHNLNTSEYHKMTIQKGGEDNYKLVFSAGQFYFFNVPAYKYDRVEKTANGIRLYAIAEDKLLPLQHTQEKEAVNFFNYKPGSNTVSNCMPVFIDAKNRLVFNNHCLRPQLDFKDSERHRFELSVERNNTKRVSTVYDKARGCFVFPDGSTVQRDPRGIVILKSSNPDIHTIYLPTSVDFPLGLSTDIEFAGSDYFYDTHSGLRRTALKDFQARHMYPFIKHIIDNAPHT